MQLTGTFQAELTESTANSKEFKLLTKRYKNVIKEAK